MRAGAWVLLQAFNRYSFKHQKQLNNTAINLWSIKIHSRYVKSSAAFDAGACCPYISNSTPLLNSFLHLVMSWPLHSVYGVSSIFSYQLIRTNVNKISRFTIRYLAILRNARSNDRVLTLTSSFENSIWYSVLL